LDELSGTERAEVAPLGTQPRDTDNIVVVQIFAVGFRRRIQSRVVRDDVCQQRAVEAACAGAGDHVDHQASLVADARALHERTPPLGDSSVLALGCRRVLGGCPADEVELVSDAAHPHRQAHAAVHDQREADLMFLGH
jgi:hypothetical protein